jgi:predicted tellurium resistance membrane protein TerC
MLAWVIPLLTLTAMEVVPGIDNIIFIALVAGRLPAGQQATAWPSSAGYSCSVPCPGCWA